MSRHDGVSCDSCMKSNFKGKRHKCLVCFDFDLCTECYEAKATTARHTANHAFQCILTPNDRDLYFGGEATTEQTNSYACPYCAKMGLTEALLIDHISSEHSELMNEVICPICAAGPLGTPNIRIADLISHLELEHRNASRDLVTFFEDSHNRQAVRRLIPLPTARASTTRNGTRGRLHTPFGPPIAIGSSTPTRDADPIADFLSRLSVVRHRTHGTTSAPAANERRGIRTNTSTPIDKTRRTPGPQILASQAVQKGPENSQGNSNDPPNMYLLPKLLDLKLKEEELARMKLVKLKHAAFIKQVVLSTLEKPDSSKEAS